MTNSLNPPIPPSPTTSGPAGTPAAAPSNTRAIVALILGILSMPCFCGFLTGIPAIILGHLEMKAINEGKSPESNRNLAKIGYILGIVGTALTCLGAIAYVALIALGIWSGEFKGPSTF